MNPAAVASGEPPRAPGDDSFFAATSPAGPSGLDAARLENSLTTLVRWGSRHDVQTVVMKRAQCSLPLSHVWLLFRIAGCGPCHPSDLASSLGVDNSTITPKLQRLEVEGLIARGPDPQDRRAALVRTTSAGTRLLGRLRRARAALLQERLTDIPEARRQAVISALAELAAALE